MLYEMPINLTDTGPIITDAHMNEYIPNRCYFDVHEKKGLWMYTYPNTHTHYIDTPDPETAKHLYKCLQIVVNLQLTLHQDVLDQITIGRRYPTTIISIDQTPPAPESLENNSSLISELSGHETFRCLCHLQYQLEEHFYISILISPCINPYIICSDAPIPAHLVSPEHQFYNTTLDLQRWYIKSPLHNVDNLILPQTKEYITKQLNRYLFLTDFLRFLYPSVDLSQARLTDGGDFYIRSLYNNKHTEPLIRFIEANYPNNYPYNDIMRAKYLLCDIYHNPYSLAGLFYKNNTEENNSLSYNSVTNLDNQLLTLICGESSLEDLHQRYKRQPLPCIAQQIRLDKIVNPVYMYTFTTKYPIHRMDPPVLTGDDCTVEYKSPNNTNTIRIEYDVGPQLPLNMTSKANERKLNDIVELLDLAFNLHKQFTFKPYPNPSIPNNGIVRIIQPGESYNGITLLDPMVDKPPIIDDGQFTVYKSRKDHGQNEFWALFGENNTIQCVYGGKPEVLKPFLAPQERTR